MPIHDDTCRTRPDRLIEILRRLEAAHGPRRWRPHHPPVDELVMTILSQHTSDANAERAYRSLRAAFPTWDDVRTAPTPAVAAAIRTGGLANLKAPRIQRALAAIAEQRDGYDLSALATLPVTEARRVLTALEGVGPKTASCVLLFSLGLPALPVDTHVHRVTRRLGLIGPTVSAEDAHHILEEALGADRDRVYAFHLTAIAHGRSVCVARQPRCDRCPLTECCDYFAQSARLSPASPPPAPPGRR